VETPSDQTSAAKIESFKDLLGENIADATPVVSTLYTGSLARINIHGLTSLSEKFSKTLIFFISSWGNVKVDFFLKNTRPKLPFVS